MNQKALIAKLTRLHTLLTIHKRSNNLALAIRKAIEFIESWPDEPDVILKHTPAKVLFVGYGPKFIRIFEDIMTTGSCPMLDDLQAKTDPFFCQLVELPSVGLTVAERMYYERNIQTIDDLRIAYTNNILQRIPAFGEARLKAVEAFLWNSQNEQPSDDNTKSPKRPRRNARIFPSTSFTFHMTTPPAHEETPQDATQCDMPAQSEASISVMSHRDIDSAIAQNPDVFGNSELNDALEAPETQNATNVQNPTQIDAKKMTVCDLNTANADETVAQIEKSIEKNKAQTFDKNLSIQIKNVIDNAQPHEIPSDIKTYEMIQARRIQANVIHARMICCRRLQTANLKKIDAEIVFNDALPPLQTLDISADTLHADLIQADWIQAREIICNVYTVERIQSMDS